MDRANLTAMELQSPSSSLKNSRKDSQIKPHNNNFTFLHFLGICMVIYSHQMVFLGKPEPFVLGVDVGGLGVKIIFLITGYLITKSLYHDYRLKNFLLRRFIRLYPALTVCLICTLILGFTVTTVDLQSYLIGACRYFMMNFLFAPNYFLPGVFAGNIYPHSVNGSLWTMPLEVMSYIIIGITLCFLRALLKDAKRINLFYTLLILFFTAFALLKNRLLGQTPLIVWNTDWGSSVTLNNIAFMLIGSLFYVMHLEKYCNLQLASVIIFSGSCIAFPYTKLLHVICLPYFVMSLGLCEFPLFSNFMRNNRIMYGMYLYAFPIQQYLVQLLLIQKKLPLPANLMFAVSLLVILLVASLSRHFIERPVENTLKKALLKKTE